MSDNDKELNDIIKDSKLITNDIGLQARCANCKQIKLLEKFVICYKNLAPVFLSTCFDCIENDESNKTIEDYSMEPIDIYCRNCDTFKDYCHFIHLTTNCLYGFSFACNRCIQHCKCKKCNQKLYNPITGELIKDHTCY